MRILVTGSRDWDDREAIYSDLYSVYQERGAARRPLFMATVLPGQMR